MYLAISVDPSCLRCLRRPARHRPLQSEYDRAFAEFDFITVVLERLRISHRRLSRRFEGRFRRRFADQRFLRFDRTPRLVRDAPQHDARLRDVTAARLQSRRDGQQREGV